MSGDFKGSLAKNKGLWIFLGVALVVAILLGVFVSPFASKSPDGLDKTAEDKGFVEKAEDAKPLWTHSPMKEYAIPGVTNEKVSTGLTGLFGVLITLVVALAIGFLVYGLGHLRGKDKDAESGPGVSAT